MKHKLLLVSLALIASIHIKAQDNFLPGMVVTIKGDTLNGWINYQNWDQNPKYIWFHNKDEKDVVTYNLSDIRSFKVADDMYIGCEVETESSSRQTESLSAIPKMNLIRKKVFVKVLVMGTKSLFQYKDSLNNDFFYIEVDGTYKLLSFKRIYENSSNTTKVLELKKYVGQLIYYLRDRPELQDKINNTSYTKSSLLDLFYTYYDRNQSKLNYETKKDKLKINYGVNTGVSFNGLLFSGSGFPELTNGFQLIKLSVTPGIFVEFMEPRNLNRWSFYNELQYATYGFESNYSSDLYTINTELNIGYLIMNNVLRYRLLLNKGALFLSGGISCGYVVREINFQKRVSKIDVNRNETGKVIDGIQRFEPGVTFGFGYTYKHLTFESRFRLGAGISPYTFLASETRSSNLMVGYSF